MPSGSSFGGAQSRSDSGRLEAPPCAFPSEQLAVAPGATPTRRRRRPCVDPAVLTYGLRLGLRPPCADACALWSARRAVSLVERDSSDVCDDARVPRPARRTGAPGGLRGVPSPWRGRAPADGDAILCVVLTACGTAATRSTGCQYGLRLSDHRSVTVVTGVRTHSSRTEHVSPRPRGGRRRDDRSCLDPIDKSFQSSDTLWHETLIENCESAGDYT